MSSVASKHALIIALGGVSIAALFYWYVQAKREEEKRKKKEETLRTNIVTPSASSSEAQPTKNSEKKQNGSAVEKKKVETPVKIEKKSEDVVERKPELEEEQKEERMAGAGESVETTSSATIEVPKKDEEGEEKKAEVEMEQNKETEEDEKEIVVPVVSSGVEVVPEEEPEAQDEAEVKEEDVEELVQKGEVKAIEAMAHSSVDDSKSKPRLFDNEQIPEEPTPTKILDQPLSLDIGAQMSPASFSWSEEMERYNDEDFPPLESSDMEPSPASPSHFNHAHGKKSRKGRNARGQNEPKGNSKKAQRKLNASDRASEEKTKTELKRESSLKESKKIVSEVQAAGDEGAHNGYEKSDSPGVDSQNSEVSSQDSGRATGGLASSLSPMDENGLNGGQIPDDLLDPSPMYEFEIPNSLVGLVIGVKGKTIRELSVRTSVRMLIRQHHTPEKVDTHQICQVRGKRDEINHCLQMLRRRFPTPRFPDLNLQPVLPPPVPNNCFDMLNTQPSWLTLPEEVICEVAISSIIDPSHFFIQQPTHPSFASLRHLDMYMLRLYGEHSQIPELPIPCQNGLLCAAPVVNAWFRAVTVQYYEDTDEVFVKFVDYGGYSKMARQDLRQIRTDLMTLPFQSTEVMLAHVRPVDGTLQWSEEAMKEFNDMCTGRLVTAKLVGYAVETRIPMIELYVPVVEGEEQKVVRFDQYLMDKGLARTSDPSKMIRSNASSVISGKVGKRPSLASQTSQTIVAV